MKLDGQVIIAERLTHETLFVVDVIDVLFLTLVEVLAGILRVGAVPFHLRLVQ